MNPAVSPGPGPRPVAPRLTLVVMEFVLAQVIWVTAFGLSDGDVRALVPLLVLVVCTALIYGFWEGNPFVYHLVSCLAFAYAITAYPGLTRAVEWHEWIQPCSTMIAAIALSAVVESATTRVHIARKHRSARGRVGS
ncbi:hypothetical protein [Cryptosporangium sp. NPDC051539]|uniref:hypothetical protein n=1 Tax=Cryptosporangium sp. NPDC051539 TaxID=3363962 RepID=UPI0037A08D1A